MSDLRSVVEEPDLAVVAERHLEKLGIPLPPKPGFKSELLKLPTKLDTLNTSRVTQHMNRWSQMLAYVKAQLALAEIELRGRQEFYDQRFAIKYLQLKEMNPKSSVTELKSQVEIGDFFLKLAKRISVSEAKKKLLEAVHEGYDQNYRLLSRELTRRTHAIDRNID